MWIKIKVVIAVTSLFLLLGGCNAFEKNHAILVQVYSSDGKQKYSNLNISKPTDKLVMGHSGLNYVVLFYSIRLAAKPEGQTIYSFSMVTLERDKHSEPVPDFVSGTILIDLAKCTAVVSLIIRDGEFKGNGTYPFTCIPPPCENFN